MNPITHGLLGWCVAQRACRSRRDAALVTLAGLAADVDGLGILVDMVRGTTESAESLYGAWHHAAGHNLAAALVFSLVAAALSRDRPRTFALSLVMFHLHLLCDLVGSRGPDGYQWPIPYLFPMYPDMAWTWSGQWEVNAWPNLLLTVILLVVALRSAWQLGFSPLWYVNARADAAVVETLRRRFPFGEPQSVSQTE